MSEPQSVAHELRSLVSMARNQDSDQGLQRKRTSVLHFLRQLGTDNRPQSPKTSHGALFRFANLDAEGSTETFSFARYGDDWYEDVLALYTNAVRSETKVLFFILYCLDERKDNLEEGDIKSFYTWYQPYCEFFCSVLELIQQVFVPWIEQQADLPQSTPRTYFEQEAAQMTRTVRKTLVHSEAFMNYAPQKAAMKLKQVFSSFAPRLFRYFAALEASTSMIAQCHYSVDEGLGISARMISTLSEKPNFKKNLVLLLRWLSDRPETTRVWRKEHLDVRTQMAYNKWKRPGAAEECLSYFLKMCRQTPDDYP